MLAVGDNSFGECQVPVLPEGKRYIAVAAGHQHSILLRDDGKAVGIGSGDWLGRLQGVTSAKELRLAPSKRPPPTRLARFGYMWRKRSSSQV